MASLPKVLTYLHNGTFQSHASDELTKLVQAVQESGRGGSLTITIKVKPTTGTRKTLTFEGDFKAKAPVIAPDATLFFPDEDGNLHVDDPRQTRMELQEVPPRPRLSDAG